MKNTHSIPNLATGAPASWDASSHGVFPTPTASVGPHQPRIVYNPSKPDWTFSSARLNSVTGSPK